MEDLFRFMLLRPADLPDADDVHQLAPPSLNTAAERSQVRARAARLLAGHQYVRTVDELTYGALALEVRHALLAGPRSAEDLRTLVQHTAGHPVEGITGDERFGTEAGRVADTLVATKLVSDAAGSDARALADAAQGYDVLRRLADLQVGTPLHLRPLVMPTFASGDSPVTFPDRRLPRPGRQVEPTPPAPTSPNAAQQRLARLEQAVGSLRDVRAQDFKPVPTGNDVPAGIAPETANVRPKASAHLTRAAWSLSSAAVARLPSVVRSTLREVNVDPATLSLPDALQHLDDAIVATQTLLGGQTVKDLSHAKRPGFGVGDLAEASEHVGTPASPMPTGHGEIHPVGVGDLLVVKQHVLRYEGGEVAHVENVLRSEHVSRQTRRLERTETTVLTERESTKEDERDTQSTDRFSLSREASSTLKEDSEFKAGVSLTASYGPCVEVKATADYASKSSSEEASKQASSFSKDVVARSVSKVVERVLERRTTTTLSEFEEQYSHGFDNTAGTSNVSGVYQWVDKVLQAQVYNYGKRLMFDVTLPEPGTAFLVAQAKAADADGSALRKPVDLTVTPQELDPGNYTAHAALYDVTGLEAPPPPWRTVSKGFAAVLATPPHETSEAYELAIDEGYRARFAYVQNGQMTYPGAVWQLMVGSCWVDMFGSIGYFDLAGEVGSVPLAWFASNVRQLAATVEIFCERTGRALRAWQLKTHAAISQGYQARLREYESALAQAKAAAGVVINGRDPLLNQRLLTTELRKQCVTLLTAQHFDAFGALELSGQGYPQPSLSRTQAQMPYVRFFEQAFEWEHIVYFFYPYFWGWKPGWEHRMLLDDVDLLFADFLRAGAARVVFPVRRGFEPAVTHYLETGEIWAGGPAPDIADSTYLPVIKEIQEASGAPGQEQPQGEPWLVRLPTTLAKLRIDDDLPQWQKVGEDWQPAS